MAIWDVARGYSTGRYAMSKIANVRLPSVASREYSAEQFNQLVRSLEQIIFQLNQTYTPIPTEDKDQAQAWFFGN